MCDLQAIRERLGHSQFSVAAPLSWDEACGLLGEIDRLRVRIEQHRNVKDTHHRVASSCEVCDDADDRLWAELDDRPSDSVPAPPARQPDRALRGYIEQANAAAEER